MVVNEPTANDFFEKFITDGNWYAPTTMAWCHYAPHATWTHPRDHRLRCDYVLCSSQALQNGARLPGRTRLMMLGLER